MERYNLRKRPKEPEEPEEPEEPSLRIQRVPTKKHKLPPGAEPFNPPSRDVVGDAVFKVPFPKRPGTSVVVPVLAGKTVAQAAKQIGTVTRQEMFELVSSAFDQPDASEMCVREANDREFLSEFFLSEMLGAGSANGEAHKICAPYTCTKKTGNCKCKAQSITLSVKLIPIGAAAWASFESSSTTPHARKLIQYQDGEATEKYELWVELTALTLANQLVIQNVCPNLPLMFRWFICKQCMYQNERLLQRRADEDYIPDEVEEIFNPAPEPEAQLTWAEWLNPFRASKPEPQKITISDVQNLINDPNFAQKAKDELLNPCAIVVNELANGGDLRKWLKGKKLPFLELRSMMFQIVAGFYALGKYFNMRHYDAHLGNVLVHELPHKDGVYKYRIDGQDYFVPHFGRLFVLWDFGWARIADSRGDTVMGAFTPKDYAAKASNPTEDISQVASLIKSWDKSYGIGASSSGSDSDSGPGAMSETPDYTMIFDEDDTRNGVANGDVLSKLEQGADDGGYASYADMFPGEFQPYFSKKANTKVIDSSWNMDKMLTPFDDADLQRLSLRSR